MRFSNLFLFIMVFSSAMLARQATIPLYINPDIDTSSVDVRNVISLWHSYLSSHPDSVYDNPYWSVSEKKQFKKFDFLNTVYFTPSLYYFLKYYKPTVMSVIPADSGYVIRTLFASQADSGFTRPFCIIRVLAKKEYGVFRLFNVLSLNTSNWLTEKVGTITYRFPPTHRFNRDLAERQKSFVDSLVAIWNLKPIQTRFYLSTDLSELMKLLGFDFYVGEAFNQGIGGLADIANGIVYGAGQNEWYPHEFVHLYINPLFPNAHHYFLEGYAALLGGSKGHDLRWHMTRMQDYLANHPEVHLDSLLTFPRFDPETEPIYVFGGLLCNAALQQGGIQELKRLFSKGTGSSQFYQAIQSVFGVNKQDLDHFIKSKLAEYIRAN